jgi:hypothetical protein
MDTLQKQFFRMVAYSAVGVISGGVIGTIFGVLIGALYYFSNGSTVFPPSYGMHGPSVVAMILNPSYSIFGGIVGGILASVYVMRAAKMDEKLDNIRKNFVMLVIYSALGMIFGSLLAVSYSLILSLVYDVILRSGANMMNDFVRVPFIPMIGGMFGAILAGILVIKMSKSEQKV